MQVHLLTNTLTVRSLQRKQPQQSTTWSSQVSGYLLQTAQSWANAGVSEDGHCQDACCRHRNVLFYPLSMQFDQIPAIWYCSMYNTRGHFFIWEIIIRRKRLLHDVTIMHSTGVSNYLNERKERSTLQSVTLSPRFLFVTSSIKPGNVSSKHPENNVY